MCPFLFLKRQRDMEVVVVGVGVEHESRTHGGDGKWRIKRLMGRLLGEKGVHADEGKRSSRKLLRRPRIPVGGCGASQS